MKNISPELVIEIIQKVESRIRGITGSERRVSGEYIENEGKLSGVRVDNVGIMGGEYAESEQKMSNFKS